MYSLFLAVLYPSPSCSSPARPASSHCLEISGKSKQVIHSTELTRNCWDIESQDKTPSSGQNIPGLASAAHSSSRLSPSSYTALTWQRGWKKQGGRAGGNSGMHLPSEKQTTAPSRGAAARQEAPGARTHLLMQSTIQGSSTRAVGLIPTTCSPGPQLCKGIFCWNWGLRREMLLLIYQKVPF